MTLNDGRRRALSAGTARGMRRWAENHKCPKCERKGAMVRVELFDGFGSAVRVCKWKDCGFSRD